MRAARRDGAKTSLQITQLYIIAFAYMDIGERVYMRRAAVVLLYKP